MEELVLAVVFWLLFNVTHAEYCYRYTGYTYCAYGCCGSGVYKTCCSGYSYSYSFYLSNGQIAGIICGILFFIAIIVLIIRLCTRYRRRGQVVQTRQYPQQTQMFHTNTSTQPAAQPYPPSQPGMAPPPYGGPGMAYSPAASQQTPQEQPWPASQPS